MASTTRASSFLPTIKCSMCSVEIPISAMGDHICAPGTPGSQYTYLPFTYTSLAPPLPEARLRALDGPFAPSISKPDMPPPPKPTKTPPPRAIATSTCTLMGYPHKHRILIGLTQLTLSYNQIHLYLHPRLRQAREARLQ